MILARSSSSGTRRRPLAACIASLFALAAPAAALADTWVVNDCTDTNNGNDMAKTGTLRYALTHATTPATINLTGLIDLNACPGNKIALDPNLGELFTSLTDVTLNGPGSSYLTIDASTLGNTSTYGDLRVLVHGGSGALTIQNLTISGGHVYHSVIAPVTGGCILSNGNVEVDNSTVTSCLAKAGNGASYSAFGGAIDAAGTVTINSSTVSFSTALAHDTDATGGGIFAGAGAIISDSIIDNNTAQSDSGNARGGNIYSGDATPVFTSWVKYGSATSNTGTARGGGVFAKGALNMPNTLVTGNTADSTSGTAEGGGVYAQSTTILTASQLTGNTVHSEGLGTGGGGARVLGNMTCSYSTIDGNTGTGLAIGGGFDLSGQIVTIAASMISGNSATGGFAGVVMFTGGAPGSSFELGESTISGNVSPNQVGGLYVDTPTTRLYSSTVAFNKSNGAGTSPGVRLAPPAAGMDLRLQNNVFSNNTYGSTEDDLDAVGGHPYTVNGGNLAANANNLIRFTSIASNKLPGDTKELLCPRLGSLRDNGGLTRTHALLSGSPAIDAGNNVPNFGFDQRGEASTNGTVDYPRISGPVGDPSPKPDIGAYEVQQDDIIFNVDFEGCPPIL